VEQFSPIWIKKMGLDERDKEMLSIATPVVDYWEMREELDRMEDTVNRLEKIVECLLELYRGERVKNWEMIIKEMLKQEKANPNVK